MDKRKILSIILGSLTIIFAFLSWWSVRQAVVMSDSSTWAVPMTFFSLYVILVCLDIILMKDVLFLELLLLCSLATSLFFAFAWLQLGAILLGGYSMFLASRRVREDMDFNLKVSIWKSLLAGKSFLLISLTIVIAMQYFIVLDNFDGEKKVPNFDMSFITKKIAIPFISTINPQFKSLQDETLTVDQFIMQTQSDALQNVGMSAESQQLLDSKIPANLDQFQKDALKKQAMANYDGVQRKLLQKNQELILTSGRKQLSDLAGTPVYGDEKISDVFTGLIGNKINSYFNPKVSEGPKNSTFSLILAIVLFLIIYPLGSILSIAWFLLTKLIVLLLFKFKVLQVRVINVPKEILE
ncbi:MAG: hypothetical protein PHW24_03785 [Candidatus Moranbacteria bacterium]|nr:hypothetical protein [Candidatus Moranbacteria bacterium]